MVANHQLELKFSQPMVATSTFSLYSYHNGIIGLKSHSLVYKKHNQSTLGFTDFR